jgi:hypothetical protein
MMYSEVAEKWGLEVEDVVDLKESMIHVWSIIEVDCKGVDLKDVDSVVAEVVGESRLFTLGLDVEVADMLYSQPWPVAIGIDIWKAVDG